MHPIITSSQNSKIKGIIALEKARERKKQNLFVIEGLKELTQAVKSGYIIHSIFFCPDIIIKDELLRIAKNENLLIPVEKSVFEKIAYRESTGGVIALAQQRTHPLEGIRLSANPFLLVVEGIEKPGNLGAILRTADAAGIDAVIVCDTQTDFYNANVIRSSVGCVFTNQLAAATTEETVRWLKSNNINILCTYLSASEPYHMIDYTKPSAIVLGTESTGLSEYWVKNSTKNIIIPMQGKIDSMNVSTAAAVVVFEARRQRGFQ